ncbi:hypothetical protein Pan44_30210 [Caulifigura coniformis]|uniref:DUF4190 domain-containing protein n=1 Tax=Caulifigura coniformis TaxID=2527983 RepID=A0A517SFV1_9PLAN|nr:hypothetical protein [Caulifigura coniformis]QDT54980.1 hypothetical protein Pan44_30210 [Caulifigura coniformis]
MSTSTLVAPAPGAVQFHEPSPEEFNYRPMSMLAVLAFALSLLSLTTLALWFMLPLAVVSLVLAVVAVVRIRSARGEYSGMKLASSAVFLSVLAFAGGLGYQVYAYQTEVLEGYERVSFSRDISDKGLVTYEGNQLPHPDLITMEGKKIFLKGFMYPTGQVFGLKSFLLVKDSDQCCFGGEPKLVDMLGVYMKGANLADFYSGRVSVAGTFRINREYKGGKLEALFQLDGVEVKPSASDFDPVKPVDLTAERATFEAKMKEVAAEQEAAKLKAEPAASTPAAAERPASESKPAEMPQP